MPPWPRGSSPAPGPVFDILLSLFALGADAWRESEDDESSSRSIEELFLGELLFGQEVGELQVSTGLRVQRDGGDWSTTIPLLLEYGLTARLQLELQLPYEYEEHDGDSVSALGNPSLGALYQLSDPTAERRFAIGGELTFPSISADVGEDGWSLEPFVLAFQRGERWDFNGGLGLELAHFSGEEEWSAHAASGWITDLGPCAGTFEVFVEGDEAGIAVSAAPGLVWHLGEFELGCAVAFGATDDAPDAELLITVTREFQVGQPLRRTGHP